MICLCVYYFIYEFNQLFNAYKDAAGIWHRDRFRTLTTAGVNLVLNLLLVKPMGLYGVILSTVVATVIVGMPWLIHNLFTTLFDGEDRQSYLGTLVFYGSVTFLNCMLTDRVCSQIPVEESGNYWSGHWYVCLCPTAFFCCVTEAGRISRACWQWEEISA